MKKMRQSKTILANAAFLIVFVVAFLKGEGIVGDPNPAFVSNVERIAAMLWPILNIVLRYYTKEAVK